MYRKNFEDQIRKEKTSHKEVGRVFTTSRNESRLVTYKKVLPGLDSKITTQIFNIPHQYNNGIANRRDYTYFGILRRKFNTKEENA